MAQKQKGVADAMIEALIRLHASGSGLPLFGTLNI